jgi:AraC family L-rhamnose operon regulatory protein RhaS
MRADVQLVSHRHTLEIFLHDLGQGRVNLGEPWTLDRMARHCGMGKTAFSKYCREITNASPVEFLNRCRLDRAAQMLLERPVSSITEVAFALGFNSSQYFAACFRQRFHTSPRSYALKKSEPQAAN